MLRLVCWYELYCLADEMMKRNDMTWTFMWLHMRKNRLCELLEDWTLA